MDICHDHNNENYPVGYEYKGYTDDMIIYKPESVKNSKVPRVILTMENIETLNINKIGFCERFIDNYDFDNKWLRSD